MNAGMLRHQSQRCGFSMVRGTRSADKADGVFLSLENSTGGLALWWEAAREWRLGRQDACFDVAARKTRAMRTALRF